MASKRRRRAAGTGSAARIGAQVRELRLASGMSQSDLAERVRSTQPSIARLEAGRVTPGIETLERIAAALGLGLQVRFVEQGRQAAPSKPQTRPARRRLLAFRRG